MRVLGFSLKWDKLGEPIHTTFRRPRKDKDWYEGEVVQEVYKPKSKEREILQIAQIMSKEPRIFKDITEAEAVKDGFHNKVEMYLFLGKPARTLSLNKLTIKVRQEIPGSRYET